MGNACATSEENNDQPTSFGNTSNENKSPNFNSAGDVPTEQVAKKQEAMNPMS